MNIYFKILIIITFLIIYCIMGLAFCREIEDNKKLKKKIKISSIIFIILFVIDILFCNLSVFLCIFFDNTKLVGLSLLTLIMYPVIGILILHLKTKYIYDIDGRCIGAKVED